MGAGAPRGLSRPAPPHTLGNTLRSALCTVAFYTWGVAIGTVMVPMLLLPRRLFRRFVITWSAGNGVLLRLIAGVHVEIRNRAHRPSGPAIIASKHQSEWEAHVFLHELDDPAYVIKKELSIVPGYGWFSAKVNMIFVDRHGGGKSLRALVRGGRKAVARGRPVVIFPEGTRVEPGGKLPYRPGVAALYGALGVPVVPVVHNSGMHWPKGSFRRYPGTIVMEYLPPIPPGLPRRDFMRRLEATMEEASQRLFAELYGPEPEEPTEPARAPTGAETPGTETAGG